MKDDEYRYIVDNLNFHRRIKKHLIKKGKDLSIKGKETVHEQLYTLKKEIVRMVSLL